MPELTAEKKAIAAPTDMPCVIGGEIGLLEARQDQTRRAGSPRVYTIGISHSGMACDLRPPVPPSAVDAIAKLRRRRRTSLSQVRTGEGLLEVVFSWTASQLRHELVRIVRLLVAMRLLPLRQLHLLARQPPRRGSASADGVMIFSRARFLSSERTTYQGAHGVSVAVNISSRARE